MVRKIKDQGTNAVLSLIKTLLSKSVIWATAVGPTTTLLKRYRQGNTEVQKFSWV